MSSALGYREDSVALVFVRLGSCFMTCVKTTLRTATNTLSVEASGISRAFMLVNDAQQSAQRHPALISDLAQELPEFRLKR